MTRPYWHLSPGADYRCAQCSGKLDVNFRVNVGVVVATCRGCGATREWDLVGEFNPRSPGDRIQFANVAPRFDYGEGGPPRPTGEGEQ